MESFIFCTSFISNDDINNSIRINRWIDYYKSLIKKFGVNYLFIIDDGSPNVNFNHTIDIIDANEMPEKISQSINFISFPDNLGRPEWENYPGWWRSYLFSITIAEKYNFNKMIHIESDFYILSNRMIEYIKCAKSGWTSFYSHYHKFPESALQIICADSFDMFKKIKQDIEQRGYSAENFTPAELILPFTLVDKGFIGDRLGQPEIFDYWIKVVKSRINLDYIGQVYPSHKSSFYNTFFDFNAEF